jgi:hypothetical protein
MMTMDPSRPIEASGQALTGERAAAALPSPSTPPVGGGYEGDVQQLTQRAVANVQSLAASLRAVCLGPSCTGR